MLLRKLNPKDEYVDGIKKPVIKKDDEDE